jgi:hypothetical protein
MATDHLHIWFEIKKDDWLTELYRLINPIRWDATGNCGNNRLVLITTYKSRGVFLAIRKLLTDKKKEEYGIMKSGEFQPGIPPTLCHWGRSSRIKK